MGSGTSTHFWTDIWKGSSTLANDFPFLFSMACNTELTVDQFLSSPFGIRRRPVRFRHLRGDELNILSDFSNRLSSIDLDRDQFDLSRWQLAPTGLFTVSSFCNGYQTSHSTSTPHPSFSLCWRSFALPKQKFFAWSILHDNLPTRAFLAHRGIIN